MDFDIKELSLTLVCGLYAALLVGFGVAYMHPKVTIQHVLRAPFLTANLDASVFSLLAMFAILMSIGICAEDLSQNAVAGRGPGFFDQPLREILPSEASVRLGVLFEGDGNTSVADRCETLAAHDFADAPAHKFAVTRLGRQYFEAVDAGVPSGVGPIELSCQDLKDRYYTYYYSAKNRVYREANYYSELKAIQARGSFGRTMAYISTIGLISLAVIVVWTELLTQLARRIAPKHRRPRLITIGTIGALSMCFIGFLAIPYQGHEWLKIKLHATCGFLVLAAGCLLFRVAFSKTRREFCGVALILASAIVPFRYMYVTEHVNYANRVFGYSESLIANASAAAPTMDPKSGSGATIQRSEPVPAAPEPAPAPAAAEPGSTSTD